MSLYLRLQELQTSLESHKFSKFMYFKIQAMKAKPYPELLNMLIK